MSDASGELPAYLRPDGPTACRCGQPVRQPWRTRDSAYSLASFIGGLAWIALGIGSVVGGWTVFGSALLGLLGVLVVGAVVLQAVRRHRGGCLLARGVWFGIAVAGLPLRIAYWFNF